MMIDKQKIADCQDKIVKCVIDEYDVPWDFAIIDFEFARGITDELMFLYKKNGSEYVRTSEFTTDTITKSFEELHKLMCDGNDDERVWNVSTLEIDATSGKYRFSFSYDPPVRLSGIALDDRMMNYRPKPW